MKFGIVTNLAGKGLQVDAELLRDFLASEGHTSEFLQFDQPWDGDKFDIGIMLEVVVEHLFSHAPRWFWIPNLEWTKPSYLKPAKKFEYIFAKTKDAERILKEHFQNVFFTGFLAQDRLQSDIKRERKFLHIGGGSGFKNTQAVLSAWKEYRYWNDGPNAQLTVVSNSTLIHYEETPGISFYKQCSDEHLKRLQNEHAFHLFPSAYEGFGHSLHEAQSVGAVILTTDAPPMNEILTRKSLMVPPVRSKPNNLATLHEISGKDIRERVPEMFGMNDFELSQNFIQVRERFSADNAAFGKRFAPFLTSHVSVAKKPTKYTVAVWGNLEPEHSTENEWVRSFEALGHRVITFQENKDFCDNIICDCDNERVDLLLYIHTHGWTSPGMMRPLDVINGLRRLGIKTVSPHLDLYFGLNVNDKRDEKVGQHAFFKTDVVMTADGSSQEKFKQRGVNHVWMRPGVVASGCISGIRQEMSEEIGFTGQRSYHEEYPFRPKMIDALQGRYGDKFKVFNGYRGESLNNLFASIPIWIGDCCFAGKPFYWSDRLPESCGRGAFLIHPRIEGMCIPTATYEPQNIEDLMNKIDYYLEHETERELIRRAAHEHVKAHDTYTHRAQEILKVVGL